MFPCPGFVSIHRRIYRYFLVKRPTKKAIAAMDEWMLMSAMPLVHWIVAVDFPLNNSYVFSILKSNIHMDWLWFSTVEIHRWTALNFDRWMCPLSRHYLCLEVLAKSPEVHVKSGDPSRDQGSDHQGCDFFFWGGIPKRSWVSISKMIWFWSTPPHFRKPPYDVLNNEVTKTLI